MLQKPCGEELLNRFIVFAWYKRFKNEIKRLQEDKHNGRPKSYPSPEQSMKAIDILKTPLCFDQIDLRHNIYPQKYNSSDIDGRYKEQKSVYKLCPYTTDLRRISIKVQEFLASEGVIVINHPP